MEVLFKELDKPENQEAISLLNLKVVYDELKASQEEFLDIYEDRLSEDAKKDYPTLREASSKAIPHLNKLIDAISILEEVEPGEHDGLVNRMNAITTEFTSIARARKSRSENGEEDGDEIEENEGNEDVGYMDS